MFKKKIVDFPCLFEDLVKLTEFEDVYKGRKGAILVDAREGAVPIIRQCCPHKEPAQQFSKEHYKLMESISDAFGIPLKFNNALIEIYDDVYCKMGAHTDQSLDLVQDSYICLFSCYERPEDKCTRKLQVQNKESGKGFEVLLENNSVVIFSTKINSDHRHKIVLEEGKVNNKWLGITFRLSKTLVEFMDGIPYVNGKELRLADEVERKQFFQLKGQENAKNGIFIYPEIEYTIGKGDLIPLM